MTSFSKNATICVWSSNVSKVVLAKDNKSKEAGEN